VPWAYVRRLIASRWNLIGPPSLVDEYPAADIAEELTIMQIEAECAKS